MAGCLRKTCPCLRTLWDRTDESSTPDGEQCVKDDSDSKGDGVDNAASDRYTEMKRLPMPPPRKKDNANAVLYKALWDFEARDDQELSFKAGEILEVLDSSGEWWTAKKTHSYGLRVITGFAPYNYLARVDTVDSQP
ncbi:hypothetical protein M9458_046594, partial [Cirrhinus mrigala]